MFSRSVSLSYIWIQIFFDRIIAALSAEERALFRERIRFLDRKIHPGLTKLTWASKGISDYFIGECRQNSSKVNVFCIQFMLYKDCRKR